MLHRVSGRDSLVGMERGAEEDIARAVTLALGENAVALKDDWRAQIRSARLGDRLANSVRSEVYPKGTTSLDAAAMVWTRAPDILSAYASGATIRPVNGARYLWLPTDEVPKKRPGNRMTPQEVEARFGRDLIVIDPQNPRMRTSTTATKRGVAYAGFSGLVPRKATGRWRNASRNQMTRGHRSFRDVTRQFVVMFTLVPMVKVSKRLDLDALATAADLRQPGLLTKHWR